MASRKLNFGTGLAIGAILLFGITIFLNNIVSNIGFGRFDLTEDKIYTVSKGAKNIMASLEVPVQVKYYVTPKDEMPAGLKTLQQDVVDKLSELSIASSGLLHYQVVNPKESEELEETLISKGIRPFQVQSVERDAVALKLVYSAISIGYKDKPEEIIPQVLPETLTNFEYALLTNVLKITREDSPVVALYTTKEPVDPEMARFYMQMGQPMPQPTDNFTIVGQMLREQGYDVRDVELTKESTIPDDAQTLIVLAPRELNERQRYEIHKVLSRGGDAIVAAQALTYTYNPGQRGGVTISVKPQRLPINDLLNNYGVRVDDRMLMDAQMATLAIPRTQTFGLFRMQVSEPVQAPVQIRVMADGINHDLPITAGVPELLYLWGTQLVVDQDGIAEKGLTVTPILRGSEKAWLGDKKTGSLTPDDFRPEGREMLERPLLAVMIEGAFPNPWEGGEIPEWPAPPKDEDDDSDGGETPDETEMEEADSDTTVEGEEAGAGSAKGRLLVLGCAKMFEDMLLEQSAHSLFLLNSVDALTLGEDLISIRSKTYERRTLGEVSDGKKLLFRLANVALMPLVVIVFGLVRKGVRRRESDDYAARFGAHKGGN